MMVIAIAFQNTSGSSGATPSTVVHVRQGRAGNVVFELPGVAGANAELAYAGDRARKVLVHPRLEVGNEGIDLLIAVRVDDELGVILIGQLGVHRQIETGWPAPDEGADVLNCIQK